MDVPVRDHDEGEINCAVRRLTVRPGERLYRRSRTAGGVVVGWCDEVVM